MLNIEDKQGYKYTEEFGYIPEDWEVKELSDSFSHIRNGFVGVATPYYTTCDDGIFYLQSNNIHKGKINENSKVYITKEFHNKHIKNALKEDDILMVQSGHSGECAVVGQKYVGCNCHALIIMSSNKKSNSHYVSYFLNSKIGQNSLKSLLVGNTIQHILASEVKKQPFVYAPLPEQEKIAEVLGDVDSLIDKTQQLINKKKDLKTATMQKLLTPKEDWVIKTLGELGEITGAGVDKKVCNDEIPVRLVNFLDVYHKDFINSSILNHWVTAKQEKITQCKVKKGDVFFTPSSEMRYDIGMSAVAIEDIENAVYSYHVVRLRLKTEFDLKFTSYIFNTKFFLNQAEIICEGSGKRYVITLPKFREMKICYPEDVKIQNKIATILSDMDSEIEALEKELSKYKDLKIGMMQQLLTGKIRLIDKEIKSDSKVVNMESAKLQNKANDEFKDAVIISMLAYKFGSEKYPLGAFRRQKLSYLFKRHSNMPIDEYMKKAMGPYNPKMKYQGAEGIAIRNKYVKEVGGRGLVVTDTISKVEDYYNRYFKPEVLDWLDKNFHYESNNNLEVLATVDYAIIDLKKQNREITLENIKAYIEGDEEWKPKLKLDYFTDSAIQKAMVKSKTLLNSY